MHTKSLTYERNANCTLQVQCSLSGKRVFPHISSLINLSPKKMHFSENRQIKIQRNAIFAKKYHELNYRENYMHKVIKYSISSLEAKKSGQKYVEEC